MNQRQTGTLSLSTISRRDRALRTIARAGWGFIAMAYLAFFLIEARLDFDQLTTPCIGDSCNYLGISPAEEEVLHSLGLSTAAYATVMIGAAAFTVAVFWALGGLILWRQGASSVGLAVSLALLAIPIAMISDPDNVYTQFPDLVIPVVVLSWLGTVLLTLFIYLIPNGSLHPRWASIPLGAAILVGIANAILEIANVGRLSSPIQLTLVIAGLGFLFLGVGFQVVRYIRASTPVERQQTKWIVVGIIVMLLGVPVWFAAFEGFAFAAGEARLLGSVAGWSLSLLASLALPVALAFAILRYRLWDIDLIIRKTLTYGILTGMLVLFYLGSVTLLQNLLTATTGQRSPLIVVMSTLAIAALFNPLRKRTQDFIDRRFYRRSYDANQALESFGLTARDEVDLDNLSGALLGVIDEAMQPERVSIWLLEASKGRPIARSIDR